MIAISGPISVADYMAEANAHYYGTRDPLGRDGDFITAPEISQMFGELAGVWLADLWLRAGRPAAHYVELGPGRGTLAVDALRAMAAAGLQPPIELVETSPVLRKAQSGRLPHARWHDGVGSLPDGGPLLVLANEFFDALPVRQFVATDDGWRERMMVRDGGGFAPDVGPVVDIGEIPDHLRGAPAGTIFESSPAALAAVREVARRVAAQGGAILVFDYGPASTSAGETLQAVAKHAYADPWQAPGERDLTAHVDFERLGGAAAEAGVKIYRTRQQGEWLKTMGIEARAAALSEHSPARAAEFNRAVARLTAADQMGALFKAAAFLAPGWPEPAGFA
ncbi:class I SAM-dependent methyltransferase [Sphingosinicella rhizophila]|uniref:SAM-dependent methyltransferase n=1 Tax=Sphingosinicella rhizophila TaxID=3050082 RepID=A0ABU3Q7B6_9SPHN|nr:SAM-dependent methyltransferase [Sphingosinicella sp. GR2756]MDT9599281.1 SAM-dependent methyltransferase [Sphingosinicella sp. GR2756]